MTEHLDAAILANSGQSADDRTYVLASLWKQENIPPVLSDAEAQGYPRAADDLSRALPPHNDPRFGIVSATFSRSRDGILSVSYGARAIEWVEHHG